MSKILERDSYELIAVHNKFLEAFQELIPEPEPPSPSVGTPSDGALSDGAPSDDDPSDDDSSDDSTVPSPPVCFDNVFTYI